MKTRWAIVTGEYPPTNGGVAHYARHVVRGLVDAGDEVHVISPLRGEAALATDPGVVTHALPDVWGPRSMLEASRILDRIQPTRLFVQYVPHSFGMRALNLAFCAWLVARREPYWVMFHEVAAPVGRELAFKHNALGVAQFGMAGIVASRAERMFATVPEWNARIRRAHPFAKEAEWLPVPSNVPTSVRAEDLAAWRARFEIGAQDLVVGHYGLLHPASEPLLLPALAALGQNPARTLLLAGPKGDYIAGRLRESNVRARLVTTGLLSLEDSALALSTCSLLVLPFADGVSTRRTSVMAAIALGIPVVSNAAVCTQSLWAEGGVGLATDGSAATLARIAEELLADDAERAAQGRRGKELYERHFCLARTIDALRRTT